LGYFQAWAVLAANSAKVTGAAPVTARTSLFGRAPLPLATVAVSGRRDRGVLGWDIPVGAITYVIWRRKKSWLKPGGAQPKTSA
jgi:hypothetical protein